MYILCSKSNLEIEKAGLIYYVEPPAGIKEMFIFIDEEKIPEPENIEDKLPILKINKTERKLFYEYIDKPINPNERIAELENQLLIEADKNIGGIL